MIELIAVKKGPHTAVGSSRSPDRVNDEILNMEWPERFPILQNHNPDKILATGFNARYEGSDFLFDFEPLLPGTTPEGDIFGKLIDQDFPIGFSISGLPDSMKPKEDGGYIIPMLRGIEISATPTPTHQDTKLLKLLKSIDADGVFAMPEEAIVEEQPKTETPPPAETLTKIGPAIRTKPPREYSIHRAIGMQLGIHGIDFGMEREIAAEVAKSAPQREFKGVPVPWNAIFKANAGATGGTLNPLTDSDAGDRLLSFTGSGLPREFLGARLGVQTAVTDEMALKVPTVDGKPAAVIVAQDGTITVSDSSTDSTTVSPVTVGCRTEVRRSAQFAHLMDDVLRKQVGDAVREGIDSTLIGPSAGSPVPDGLFDLVDTAAVATIPDTEAGYRVFARELLAYLKNPDAPARFLVPGSVADVLAITPRFTNAQRAVYENEMIAGIPVVISHELDETTPASTPVAVGDFGEMFVCLFGNAALDVIANPWITGSWEVGGYELRALLDFNIHCRDTASILQAVSDRS